MVTDKLTNLQLELIKLYRFSIDDHQLMDIKKLLGDYFAAKATEEMDELWQKNNWDNDTMNKWLNEENK